MTDAPGFWPSPIDAARVTEGTVRRGCLRSTELAWWWTESRPDAPRQVQVVRCSENGERNDVLPEGFSVGGRVNEYGGGGFTPFGETVFFVNATDQGIYRLDPGFDPLRITADDGRDVTYGDLEVSPDGRWVIAVEDADGQGHRLVCWSAMGGQPCVLAETAGFFRSPRIDPTGRRMVWVEHHQMPWDGTVLWAAEFADSPVPALAPASSVAGGAHESVLEPQWDPDGRLWFVSDRTQWWNLYHLPLPGKPEGEPVLAARGSYEVCAPGWLLGEQRYCFLSDQRVVFAATASGEDRLYQYEVLTRRTSECSMELTHIEAVAARGVMVAVMGGSYDEPDSIRSVLVGRPESSPRSRRISAKHEVLPSSGQVSHGQPFAFPSGDMIAHGIYYPPKNPGAPLVSHAPPLIVQLHGGPTWRAQSSFQWRTQYWTSHGFALVDLNYRGSTGFGRKYRDALYGGWGVVDVDDCIAVVKYLAELGRGDPERCFIRGSSAGGYTALLACCGTHTFRGVTALYPVTEPRTLLDASPRFERDYSRRLFGANPRSVVDQARLMDAAALIMQGDQDRVVPPQQAEVLVSALRAARAEVEYRVFVGEGHGFRGREATIAACELELAHYQRCLSVG